tara:strand:- start:278 stop:685 length:408 start_codon:yes stop_codon:yes gene_type:complete
MDKKSEFFEVIKKHATPIKDLQGLCFGQVVVTGLSIGAQYDFDNAVGFVCQIRREADDSGGDVFLLRHPAGELVCHVNQGLFAVPEDIARRALSLFIRGIEVEMIENPSLEYTIGEYLCESGFIIEKRIPVDPFI